MTLFLIRHADAGDRRGWDGDDHLRPLSAEGRRQARALAMDLGARGVGRVLTSPAVRCRETVEPLAALVGCEVEVAPELLEGSDPPDVIRLLEASSAGNAGMCTHGDLIPEVIELLHRRGMEILGERGNRKGSCWEIEPTPDGFRSARYHPPG